MTRRDPIVVILLTIVTLGFYAVFWFYWTKNEMRARGADIPTFLLYFLPLVNYYWLWKWCEGAEMVTARRMSSGTAFLLIFFLGIIGGAIVQNSFNQPAA
jgi:hypothetical protein